MSGRTDTVIVEEKESCAGSPVEPPTDKTKADRSSKKADLVDTRGVESEEMVGESQEGGASGLDVTTEPCSWSSRSEVSVGGSQLKSNTLPKCSNMNNMVIPKRRCKMFPPMKVVSNSVSEPMCELVDDAVGAKPPSIVISPVVKKLKAAEVVKIHQENIFSKSLLGQSKKGCRRSRKTYPVQEISIGEYPKFLYEEDNGINENLCNLSQGLIAEEISHDYPMSTRVGSVNSLEDTGLDSVTGTLLFEQAKNMYSNGFTGGFNMNPLLKDQLPLTLPADFVYAGTEVSPEMFAAGIFPPLQNFDSFPGIAEKKMQAKAVKSVMLSDDIYQMDIYSSQNVVGTTSPKNEKGRCENVCGVCEKVFALGSDLRKHKMIHENLRPFKCNICGKGFNSLSTRNSHQKIHADDRPYKCKHCEMTFKKSHNRTVHERKHTGDKPHVCHVCHRAFAAKSSLKRHLKRHDSEKTYGYHITPDGIKQLTGTFYTRRRVPKPNSEQILSNELEQETSWKGGTILPITTIEQNTRRACPRITKLLTSKSTTDIRNPKFYDFEECNSNASCSDEDVTS